MEKLKVDIITMDGVPNYGSVLQAFATQKILEANNCDVTIINYIRENVKYENLLQTWCGGNILKLLAMYPTVKRWKHVFQDFRQNNLCLSEYQYTTEKDFESYPLYADIYCTGSDQVWNSKWNDGIIPPLYLSFVPADKFKVAFSASFGQSRLSKREVEKTKQFIDEYNFISVREESGLKILLDQYGFRNVVQLLDPTLILTAEEWRKYAFQHKMKNPYILIYNLNRSREFDQYALRLAKKTGLKLVRFCTRYDQFYRPGKSILVPEVFSFITWIDNATYVLTDSFHATAFSMNMGTEPICFYPKEFGGRIESFLKLTRSVQRHVVSYKDLDVINRPVDFSAVNSILNVERKKAMSWIDMILKEVRVQRG